MVYNVYILNNGIYIFGNEILNIFLKKELKNEFIYK